MSLIHVSPSSAMAAPSLPATTHPSQRRTAGIALSALSALIVFGLSGAMPSAQAQTAAPTMAAAPSATATPIGIWKTIDDATREPRALIRIYTEPDGSLSGKIIKVLDKDANPEKRCDECTDDRKNQLIQGLRIIDKMRANGAIWDQGRILDPENGKLYRCKMSLEDGGRKLIVRGYIGVSLLGRSQTWFREE